MRLPTLHIPSQQNTLEKGSPVQSLHSPIQYGSLVSPIGHGELQSPLNEPSALDHASGILERTASMARIVISGEARNDFLIGQILAQEHQEGRISDQVLEGLSQEVQSGQFNWLIADILVPPAIGVTTRFLVPPIILSTVTDTSQALGILLILQSSPASIGGALRAMYAAARSGQESIHLIRNKNFGPKELALFAGITAGSFFKGTYFLMPLLNVPRNRDSQLPTVVSIHYLAKFLQSRLGKAFNAQAMVNRIATRGELGSFLETLVTHPDPWTCIMPQQGNIYPPAKL